MRSPVKFKFGSIALVLGLVITTLFLMGYKNQSDKPPTKHTVEIHQMKFNPATLTVHKGDTVVWINKDYVPHDVTDEDNHSWTSGTLDKGQKWSKVITKDVNYFCSIHVVMKGAIKVVN